MSNARLVMVFMVAMLAGCPSSGTTTGESVAYNTNPEHMVVDGNEIYWVDQGTIFHGALDAIPIEGLDAEVVTTGAVGTALAVSATDVYFGTDQGIAFISKIGGAVATQIGGSATPLWITVQGDSVFWCTDGINVPTVHWVKIAGGVVANATVPDDETLQLQVDASTVYVRGYQGVHAISRSDQQVTRLALASDYDATIPDMAPQRSISMALDGDHLDWLIHQIGQYADQDLGALIEIPLAGGAPHVVVSGLLAPTLLQADGAGTRYWYEDHENHTEETFVDGLRRLGPGETMPTVIAPDVTGAIDTAVGQDWLYWAMPGSMYDHGSIRRVQR